MIGEESRRKGPAAVGARRPGERGPYGLRPADSEDENAGAAEQAGTAPAEPGSDWEDR
ncbi:hypothetical protein GCM10010346_62490 [Streptomyces chryseus]|uniref:Uncharacterized protein n=1 Tax=Streptomyces chryseus TaxID=68186 RepID=A0ABQ3E9N3_9ACTN|nr:hypothetical protein GCM10010346_62490 [Streptomyces chryseus]